MDLNIGVLTRIWKSLYAQNYPRNSFELKIGLAHKSSAQECYESLFVEAYLPILRLTFSFLQNEAKLRRSECLSSIIATLISYCNPIKLLMYWGCQSRPKLVPQEADSQVLLARAHPIY